MFDVFHKSQMHPTCADQCFGQWLFQVDVAWYNYCSLELAFFGLYEEGCVATVGQQEQTREELAATLASSKGIQEPGPKPHWHREKNSSRPERPHRWPWPARQDSSVLYSFIMAHVIRTANASFRS